MQKRVTNTIVLAAFMLFTVSTTLGQNLLSGDTWTEINSGLIEEDIQTLAINPEGYLFAGVGNSYNPEGVFRTVNSTISE